MVEATHFLGIQFKDTRDCIKKLDFWCSKGINVFTSDAENFLIMPFLDAFKVLKKLKKDKREELLSGLEIVDRKGRHISTPTRVWKEKFLKGKDYILENSYIDIVKFEVNIESSLTYSDLNKFSSPGSLGYEVISRAEMIVEMCNRGYITIPEQDYEYWKLRRRLK